MFNKDSSLNIQKIELNNKRFYKQYNNISITPFFIVLLNNYYEEKNMQDHIDFDNRINAYNNRAFENSIKKQYNNIITNLYQNGEIIIDNGILKLDDLYIVYKKGNNDFHLMCTNSKYINDNTEYDTSVKFIDTTAFIDLIKKNDVKNNSIILNDINDLKNIIQDWDGLLHDKVYKTDAILNKNMLGKNNYE